MNNIVIVKSGSLFSTLSHIGNNDLVLDENVSIELYNNASISIGNNIYYYGPITNNNMCPILNNDSDAFLEGYLNTDINGDGFVEAMDYPILNNNSDNFIESIHPY